MNVPAPTATHLAEIAARLGISLTDEDLETFTELVAGSLASYDVVDRLTDPTPEPKYFRESGKICAQEENPLGAWYSRGTVHGASTGVLAGRKVVIKDNISVAKLPMMNGSAVLAGYTPSQDATVVTRLLDAGAQIVGKAVCEDLCFSGGSHTPATGPVRNPWDLKRSAGGSSGGCAALLASGEVQLAVGGDQGGSVRIPSSFCGTVGHKPTYGLVPYTGAVPIEATVDHLGPMAMSVVDVAQLLTVLAGPDGADHRQLPVAASPAKIDYLVELDRGVAGLRIGVLTEGFGWEGLSNPELDKLVRDCANRLTELGAEVEPVSVPMHTDGIHIWNAIAIEGATVQLLRLNSSGMNHSGFYDPELAAALHKGFKKHSNELSDAVKLVGLTGEYLIEEFGGTYYAKARNLAGTLTEAYDAAFAENFDLLVLPTLPITATVLPDPKAGPAEKIARALEMIVNTCPFDVTGHPALSVPAGLVDGLPAGMMFVGRRFEDATVLRAGHAWERLSGGFMLAP